MQKTSAQIQYIAEKRKAFNNATKLHWVHWLVIFLSTILTLTAWYVAKQQVDERANRNFDRMAENLVERIYERMGKYEDALWSGVAAINSQSFGIDYEEWQRFANTLNIEERYPGVNGIGVIYHVKREDLNSFMANQREMRPEFKMHPKKQGDENNQEFLPITYIEPSSLNKRAEGLDVSFEKNRYEAAKKAQRTGKPNITAPIVLVQDSKKTPGFLFYVPFYKEAQETQEQRIQNFQGMVYAPFIVSSLMEGTLGHEGRLIGVRIRDGESVLYDEHLIDFEDFDAKPMFKKTISLEVYGRAWEFDVETKKSFEANFKSNQPFFILMAGLLIEGLLLVVFILLVRSNKKALEFAGEVAEQYEVRLHKQKLIEDELEEAKNFKDVILNTIPSLIFVKDSEFRIIEANDSFMNMYPPEMRDSVIGFTTVEKYEPKAAEEFLKNDKIAMEEGFHETQETLVFPDGKTRTLLTRKIGFNNGGERLLLGVAHDITTLKEAETEILRSNLELERFAYIASHDLQEPLRMVSNFTSLLEDEYKENFDETALTYMKFISEASGRMQSLVNDLLDYSRVGQQEMGSDWIDANRSLEQTKENLKETIEETKAVITTDNLPEVYASGMRFLRVLQNLVGNAMKYQVADNTPKIHVGASLDEAAQEWVFSVKDNGIGMNPEYLEQIFLPFKRLHHKNEYSGTGIGLAICQKIVESLGGRIWVESKLDEGSCFYFTVPVANEKREKEEND